MLSNDNRQLSMLADSPISELQQDRLQFIRYVEPLCGVLTSPATETPLAIGIFGDWGTGKTTLMKLLAAQLDQKIFPCVWFNPWLFHSERNMIVPLLETIQDAFKKTPGERFKKSAQRIATVVAQVSASVFLKTITLDKVSFKDIQESIDDYNKKRSAATSAIRELRNKLQSIVSELTENGQKGRLIIFIDDLDRCVPTKIVEVLEDIKLFLDLEHTVVLLSIDKEIVQRGLHILYKDLGMSDEQLELITNDYMDKVLQLPIVLPPFRAGFVGDYLHSLPLSQDLQGLVKMLEICLQPNPRKIKRIINILELSLAISINEKENTPKLNKELLAKLIILQQQWHRLYREVSLHPELLVTLERVYKGKLRLEDADGWLFLGEKRQVIKDICQIYYRPASLMNNLWIHGSSFEDVDVDPYLYILG